MVRHPVNSSPSKRVDWMATGIEPCRCSTEQRYEGEHGLLSAASESWFNACGLGFYGAPHGPSPSATPIRIYASHPNRRPQLLE